MKYIALPFKETRRLSFYLAMEEFVALYVAGGAQRHFRS